MAMVRGTISDCDRLQRRRDNVNTGTSSILSELTPMVTSSATKVLGRTGGAVANKD
jgi:hypothetical protein